MVGWIRKHALLVYFALAYVLTWGGSLLHLTLSGDQTSAGISAAAQIPAALLVLLGPALAALAVASIERGTTGLRALLRPLRTWRVGAGWWALVFAYPIVHHLIIVGIRWALGGPVPRFFDNPAMPQGGILLARAQLFWGDSNQTLAAAGHAEGLIANNINEVDVVYLQVVGKPVGNE